MARENFDEVTVLGTRFHKVTVTQLIKYLMEAANTRMKSTVCHVNVRAINIAYDLHWYRDFLNSSNLVFCDGFGVLLGARLIGYSIEPQHRMTCPDFIEDLALNCEREQISLFLLAGKPGVVAKAIVKLKAIAPKLKIDGHHGYFDKTGAENNDVITRINQFKPGILYIGFGMPLQERWVLDNMHNIEANVFLPLGACLDFYTGTVYRGPRWMTDKGLEWLSRLFIEPERLWQRYVVGNPLFLYRIIKQRLQFTERKSF